DDCDFSDLEALNVISKLYFEGLIYDASTGTAREEGAVSAEIGGWLAGPTTGRAAHAQLDGTLGDEVAGAVEAEKRDAPEGWRRAFEDQEHKSDSLRPAQIAVPSAPVSLDVEMSAEPGDAPHADDARPSSEAVVLKFPTPQPVARLALK